MGLGVLMLVFNTPTPPAVSVRALVPLRVVVAVTTTEFASETAGLATTVPPLRTRGPVPRAVTSAFAASTG